MKELDLIFPSEIDEKQVMEYLEEHLKNGEKVLNGAGRLEKIEGFNNWLQKIREDRRIKKEGRVLSTLYLAIRKKDGKLVGMTQLREELNEKLLQVGGHIGYGVRPSERKKGYATEMLKLALEKSKELGIKKVLLTCDKNNENSRKVILKNGGLLENEICEENGNIVQRYWISLDEK